MKSIALIDDDEIFHLLMKACLKQVEVKVELTGYMNGQLAFDQIRNARKKDRPEIILLDINMPVCNGWMFLDLFDGLKENVKNSMRIFMVSSSIDPMDIERANTHPLVVRYIEKPISESIIREIVGD